MDRILIVDDEKNYLTMLRVLFSEEGYEVFTALSADEALKILEENEIDIILTDVKMPRLSGMEFLERIKLINPIIPVILMTAYGTIEMAVSAMKKGAFDYITKPFKNEDLLRIVYQGLALYRLKKENLLLKSQLGAQYSFGNIVGKSKAMKEVFDLVRRVAPTKATVLITGESGTGKELVAKAIHYNSPRKDGPFVSVSCSALSPSLLESELFGHEKGAFTGAISSRKGRFELADKGTLFLDEIGDIPLDIQVKLLRVIQEKNFERVGGNKNIAVDVRIIAATNRDLKKAIKEGSFRDDLYFRLNVVHINLPPLRKRKEDIPLLVNTFLERFKKEVGRPELSISPEALHKLYNYDWPGNVRELENVIESAVILAKGDVIEPHDLVGELSSEDEKFLETDLPRYLERIERELIERALRESDNVQVQAAKKLGITKSLLQYKMKKYGLK